MAEALDAGWRRAQGLKRVTVEARDLFRRPLLTDELASVSTRLSLTRRAPGAEAQSSLPLLRLPCP